jgi:nitrate/nitrite transport system permease protein
MTVHMDLPTAGPLGAGAAPKPAAAQEGRAGKAGHSPAHGATPAAETRLRPGTEGPERAAPPRPPWQAAFEQGMVALILPAASLGLVMVAWSLARTYFAPELPTVAATWARAVEVFGAPLRDLGPNDKGIAWQLAFSLMRVGAGFLLAVAVGLPLGFLLGMSATFRTAWMPLIQVLRPVSPLAWLPIGLLLFKAVNPSAVFVIAITSIWPIILNVAAGVQAVPKDYLNVAAILRLGRIERVRRIMLPATLPFVITGMRLSLGTAWMVIVAAEMLTGGIGIGFYVWDEWNNLNIASILVAIAVIGCVGIVLDGGMSLLQRRLDFTRS